MTNPAPATIFIVSPTKLSSRRVSGATIALPWQPVDTAYARPLATIEHSNAVGMLRN